MAGPSCLVAAGAAEGLEVGKGLAVALLLDPLAPRRLEGAGIGIEFDEITIDVLQLAGRRWKGEGEAAIGLRADGQPGGDAGEALGAVPVWLGGHFGRLPLGPALQGPVAVIGGHPQAGVALGVADVPDVVVRDGELLAGSHAKGAAKHLEVQGQAVGGSGDDDPADGGDVGPLAGDIHVQQHLEAAVCEVAEGLPSDVLVGLAVDDDGGNAGLWKASQRLPAWRREEA